MPRTQSDIEADAIATLLSATDQITNLNVGSVARSLMTAIAAVGAELEQEITDQISQAILNAAFAIWQITPLPAVPSTYALTFSNSTGSIVNMSSNTVVAIPSSTLQWKVASAFSVPANGNIVMTGVCTTTGFATNVPANSISMLVTPVSGISVTNASGQAIIQGADAETQTQTQARLANTISSLHRGDSEAVEAGVLDPDNSALKDSSGNITEQVIKALAVDLSAGKAITYIYNGVGTASSDLITQVENVVQGYTDANGIVHIGYKAAGINMTILNTNNNSVNVTAAVLPQTGYTLSMVTSAVQNAITTFFNQLDIEESMSVTLLEMAITHVPGISDAIVSTPSATLVGLPSIADPTVAPSLTAYTISPTTALTSGTYYVTYTFTNLWGETSHSPSQNVAITANQAVQVAAITLPFGATGINYYFSIAANSSTVAYDTNGTGALINLIALPVAGAASEPTSNTAVIHGNLYVAGTITINSM